MLNKDQLIFDPTAVSTADCDTVGAHLLDGDGNKITSTAGALDVNVASGTFDATGSVVALDAATLAALEDITAVVSGTVGLDAATLAALESITVSGQVSLDAATLAALEDVTATVSGTVALDAATLAALEDITATVSGTVALDAATLAALENVTVTATDLDIRDLTAATDSVSISDGTDSLAINADGSINVQFAAAGKQSVVETNNGCAHAAVSVTTTAAPLVATPLADRTTIHIQNTGSSPIYIGCDATVTSTNGTRIPKGGSAEFKFSDAVSLHAITANGTADVRIIELACA